MEKMDKLYRCDPDKNTKCKKTACFINGGECFSTTDVCYAKTDAYGKPIRDLWRSARKQEETEPIYEFTMLDTRDLSTDPLIKDRLYSFFDPCCATCAYCLGGKCRLKYMYNGECVGGDRDIPDKDHTVCQLWEMDD